MTFQFGKPAIKSVPGAVSDSVRSIRLNRPPDDPYMKWNDVGEWMDEVEIGLEKLLLWSGIKKAETPAQTLIAESLVGIQTQAGAQKFVWLDEPYAAVAQLNKTATAADWADCDISSIVPEGTYAVYLFLRIGVDVIGADDKFLWQVRKAANTEGAYPSMIINDYAEAGDSEYAMVIVGLTSDRIFQFKYTITNSSGAAQGDFVSAVLGYFKTG
jgi:hypothetical protein